MAVHGPGMPGDSTPRPSGSPTVVTSAYRSITGARPGTAKSSSMPATSNGARRCTTTSWTQSGGSSARAMATPSGKQAESEQIVTALEERGIDHEYLLFDDEGHGFAKPGNRLRFYAAAEAFLARHLGGRTEP